MNEPFQTDALLVEMYQHFFDLLLKCLLISVVGLLAATVMLIILCCRETVREGRDKIAEKSAREESPRVIPDGRGTEPQAEAVLVRPTSRMGRFRVRWLDTAMTYARSARH